MRFHSMSINIFMEIVMSNDIRTLRQNMADKESAGVGVSRVRRAGSTFRAECALDLLKGAGSAGFAEQDARFAPRRRCPSGSAEEQDEPEVRRHLVCVLVQGVAGGARPRSRRRIKSSVISRRPTPLVEVESRKAESLAAAFR